MNSWQINQQYQHQMFKAMFHFDFILYRSRPVDAQVMYRINFPEALHYVTQMHDLKEMNRC